MKRIGIIAMVLLLASIKSMAQNNSRMEVSVEVDPATFLFRGYGVHLRVKPAKSEHLLVGAGAYAMDFPDVFVDMNKHNRNKGWEVRLNQGAGIFAEYFFSEVNNKWFVGGQLAIQEYEIGNTWLEGASKFTNGLIMPYAGYTWKPFDNGFYLKPWAGIGLTSKFSGSDHLGSEVYDIAPIVMFATLHVGYTF